MQVGWSLREPERSAGWDGLTKWFVDWVGANRDLLKIAYIRDWYSVSLSE